MWIKPRIAAGASGIACGVVRNNYFQPAMRELMAHSVDEWESDAETYSYHPVGYMQISPECMREDVASIYEQQRAIGYESVFIEGAAASERYMKGLFDDWQAKGITSVLHEKRGGYANNQASMLGLAAKAKGEGVSHPLRRRGARLRVRIEQPRGDRAQHQPGPHRLRDGGGGRGPWVNNIWNMLDLPKRITVKDLTGKVHHDVPMWKFWCLEEGTLAVDPNMHKTNDGRFPPVIHVDTDAPLYSDRDGQPDHRQTVGHLLQA